MSADLVLPIIASLGWLMLAGSAVASFRLGWGTLAKMTLVWLAIFAGLFLMAKWFEAAQETASRFV